MQFRLSNLFTLTALIGLFSFGASVFARHWDLRSYYVGFYGRDDVPSWATGTGRDWFSESLGTLMGTGWQFAPWIALFGAAALLGASCLQMKGTAR